MRLEGLGELKNPMTSPGIEPANFWLVAWENVNMHCRYLYYIVHNFGLFQFLKHKNPLILYR
jgi:hypothetical protein